MAKHLGFMGAALIALAGAAAPAAATTGVSNIIDADGTYAHAGLDVGAFSDTYGFTTPSAGQQSVDISFFASGIASLSASLNGAPVTILPQANGSYYGSLSTMVMAGAQTLMVSGVARTNGSYAGNVSFGAVPEPAAWAMMLVGFGLVGATTRRMGRRMGRHTGRRAPAHA